MSVARTARRRRKQAAMGKRGLEQVYGKMAAPQYPRKRSLEKSQRLLADLVRREAIIRSKARKKG